MSCVQARPSTSRPPTRRASLRPQGTGPHALDITDSGDRQSAVAATIDHYSLDALDKTERDRFWELGIFAEDSEVPLGIVKLLWEGTAGLSGLEAEALCERLDGLALLSLAWADNERVIILHDVIRDFARVRLGAPGSAVAHAALIEAARNLARAGGAASPGHSRASADAVVAAAGAGRARVPLAESHLPPQGGGPERGAGPGLPRSRGSWRSACAAGGGRP